MCLANCEEPILSWVDWLLMFPNGQPAFYTDIDTKIDTTRLPGFISKGSASEYMQWAQSRNAERARRIASCQTTAVYPWLRAALCGSKKTIGEN